MKWYGRYFYYFENKISRVKKRNLNKSKYLLRAIPNRLNTNSSLYSLYVPASWKFLIITPKTSYPNSIIFYLFSKSYFFFLTVPVNFLNLSYDRTTSCLTFLFFYKNNFYNIFFKTFLNIFLQFARIFFKKLKFKGKGYYIYKNIRNTIALQFGYSHLFYLYSYFTNVKFITKTSILIFGLSAPRVVKAGKSLFRIKPINIFTGKGIRFSRQIIYKKTGKISSYR